MTTLPGGVTRTIHVDRDWVVSGFGCPMKVIDVETGIHRDCNEVKINGPSKFIMDYYGAGAQHTVHVHTSSELEVS